MTTTYGTISTTPDPPFLSRARSGIGARRPWRQMVASLGFPESFNAALQRIRTNAAYFHVNYAIIVLFALFLSLLWHPVSLIVFMVTMAAWLFLYFLRDDPIVVCGFEVEERVVLVLLSIFTVCLLFLTHAVVFMAGLAVGLLLVMVHGVFRRTNDLIVDGGDSVVDLKDAASSYSSSV